MQRQVSTLLGRPQYTTDDDHGTPSVAMATMANTPPPLTIQQEMNGKLSLVLAGQSSLRACFS